MGRIFLHWITFTDVGDLLELRIASVTVGSGELTLFVQRLTVLEMHHLSRLGVEQAHIHIAGDVLPKVDDRVPGIVPDQRSRKPLFLFHWHTASGDQLRVSVDGFNGGGLPVSRFYPGIIDLALL